MANPAMMARLSKEKHPEKYCTGNKACLWRTATRNGFKPCPKHMQAAAKPEVPQPAEVVLTREQDMRICELAYSFVEGSNQVIALSSAITDSVKRAIASDTRRKENRTDGE